MGRMILIGGGTYEEIDEFNKMAAKMTKKDLPNALFIGTALQDSTNPLTSFKKSFKRACPGAQVKKLSIIRSIYTEEEIDSLLSWADVIFVGGGNTLYMLSEWKKVNLYEKLLKIYEENSAVIMGISAGAICWFQKGYTDSDAFSGNETWEYKVFTSEKFIYPSLFCPHYNDEKRSGFDKVVEQEKMNAVAVSDRTAFIEENGNISYVSLDPEMKIYLFEEKDGLITKKNVTKMFQN